MKKFFIIILSVFLMPDAFSQYFNTTQINVLMGNRPINERNESFDARTQFFPSVTMTNGIRFNDHLAAGLGVGVEISDRYLFPAFLDIRYTLLKNKVSPFLAFKTGNAFGAGKNLTIIHTASYEGDIYYNRTTELSTKKSGGLMVHPEIGVRIPLGEKADLFFTVAYRYQEIKTTVTQNVESESLVFEQNNKTEIKESINRLSFGVGIMFK